MDSFSNFFFILSLVLIGSQISESQTTKCSSQTFTNNRTFEHCQDLPHLNAFLHWTHDPKNSSLSIAYIAPPISSAGWVAWAVNPTGTGMAGAQAFLAYLNGTTPTLRTLNISSPTPAGVQLSPLSFPVWDLSVESSPAPQFSIFASFKVPANALSLNQVWQAGPGVDPDSGAPQPHPRNPDNLNAKSVLMFDTAAGPPSSSPPTDGAGGGNGTPMPPSPPGSDAPRFINGILGSLVGFFGCFFFLF